jgi:hypothetical protein
MEYLDENIVNIIKKNKLQEHLKDKFESEVKQIVDEILKGNVTTNGVNLEIEQKPFFDNKFHICIPKKFQKLPEKLAKIKYPNESRPQTIFCNKNDTVNIGINFSEEEVENEDVPLIRDIMKDGYKAVYPHAKTPDVGERIIDDYNVAYYTFISFAIGGQMYNHIFIFSCTNKVVVISLNCLKKDMDTWKPFFYAIMDTIRINHIKKGD